MSQPQEKSPAFSIQDRLNFGSFSIAEALALSGVSNSKFYRDARAGLIEIRKRGAASFVAGPDLRRYIHGSRATPENSRIPPAVRRKAEAAQSPA
jgi:hypothetical protein